MDIGLIFRTGKPLDRKHYLVGNLIVWSVLFAAAATLRAVGIPDKTESGLLFIFVGPIVLGAVYLFLFRLRRIVDIGFSSWTTAGIALVTYGIMMTLAGKVHPYAQVAIAAAFELSLLLAATGANVRKNASLPSRDRW